MKGPDTEKIQKLFDGIATDYDSLNHILSLGIDRTWRSRALKWIVDRDRPQRILDVACGTGDFSIAIARKSSPQTRITGLDLSKEMLKVMKGKVVREGLDRKITTIQGDCSSLPFEDGTFDAVTIAFGIRNFEDREAALREILRVLKGGGRLVILELSVPSGVVMRSLYKAYFCHILPLVGGRVSGDKAAYRYLPASVLSFPPKEQWLATMASCGFSRPFHKAFTFGICRMYVAEK